MSPTKGTIPPCSCYPHRYLILSDKHQVIIKDNLPCSFCPHRYEGLIFCLIFSWADPGSCSPSASVMIFSTVAINDYQIIVLLSHQPVGWTKLNLKWSYITDPVALICITTTYFWVDQDKISNNQIWDQNSKPHPAALLTWQSESLKSAFNQGRSWQKNDEIDNWHAATVVSTLLLLLVSNIWRIMARWCVDVSCR